LNAERIAAARQSGLLARWKWSSYGAGASGAGKHDDSKIIAPAGAVLHREMRAGANGLYEADGRPLAAAWEEVIGISFSNLTVVVSRSLRQSTVMPSRVHFAAREREHVVIGRAARQRAGRRARPTRQLALAADSHGARRTARTGRGERPLARSAAIDVLLQISPAGFPHRDLPVQRDDGTMTWSIS
jgi:hypothetical protein